MLTLAVRFFQETRKRLVFMSVVAIKNGKKRTFTDQTWELLGKNKEGWNKLDEVSITNIAKRPETGEKTKAPTAAIEQKITNTVTEPQTVTNVSGAAPADKEKFLLAAEGLNAGIIKDYFDGEGVAYKKASKKVALAEALGEHLNWNIAEFQRLFS